MSGASEAGRPLTVAIACPPELGDRVEQVLGSGHHAEMLAGAEAADSSLPREPPAVVILSLGASLTADEARIARLLRRAPATSVIALADDGALARSGTLRRLLRIGVKGIVEIEQLESTLEPAIDVVLLGEIVLPARMREELSRPALSHREKEILMLVAEGFTNSEIAARLYLSESTVKSHLTTSFRKLQVSSRAEAAKRALEQAGSTEPPGMGSPVE